MKKRSGVFSPFLGNSKVEDVAFTIGAEASNAINVAIQLKADGKDLDYRAAVWAYLSTDANGDNVTASAPSGGFAIGTDGVAIEAVADKLALLISEADGDIDITITESTAKTFYLVVVLPDGSLKVSNAITFA